MEFAEFVFAQRGRAWYDELRVSALSGVKMKWAEEVERLKLIKGDLSDQAIGVDDVDEDR